jgi:hypothetical protein
VSGAEVLEAPARVLTGDGHVLFRSRVPGAGTYFCAAGEFVGRAEVTLADLDERLAGWRPVMSATAEDLEQVRAVVVAAGRRAAISVAAAVAGVMREVGREELCAAIRPEGRAVMLERVAALGVDLAPGRVDEHAVEALAALIRRWVTDERVVTDVGLALGAAFADAVEEWQDGWGALADDELLRGGSQARDGEVAYLLLVGDSHQWVGSRYRR